MKKIIFSILFLIAFSSLFSCGNKKNDKGDGVVVYDTIPVTNIKIAPEYFFSGEFIYMADAAVLKETATNTNIPVAMEEHYPEAEKMYTDLKPAQGQGIYSEFLGFLKQKGEDEEGPDNQLVITKVITMDKSKKASSGLLTGTYSTADQNLVVNPDHTYVLSSTTGESEKGNWYLTIQDVIVFTAGNGHTIMDVNLPRKELKTRDDIPVVFKKKQV